MFSSISLRKERTECVAFAMTMILATVNPSLFAMEADNPDLIRRDINARERIQIRTEEIAAMPLEQRRDEVRRILETMGNEEEYRVERLTLQLYLARIERLAEVPFPQAELQILMNAHNAAAAVAEERAEVAVVMPALADVPALTESMASVRTFIQYLRNNGYIHRANELAAMPQVGRAAIPTMAAARATRDDLLAGRLVRDDAAVAIAAPAEERARRAAVILRAPTDVPVVERSMRSVDNFITYLINNQHDQEAAQLRAMPRRGVTAMRALIQAAQEIRVDLLAGRLVRDNAAAAVAAPAEERAVDEEREEAIQPQAVQIPAAVPNARLAIGAADGYIAVATALGGFEAEIVEINRLTAAATNVIARGRLRDYLNNLRPRLLEAQRNFNHQPNPNLGPVPQQPVFGDDGVTAEQRDEIRNLQCAEPIHLPVLAGILVRDEAESAQAQKERAAEEERREEEPIIEEQQQQLPLAQQQQQLARPHQEAVDEQQHPAIQAVEAEEVDRVVNHGAVAGPIAAEPAERNQDDQVAVANAFHVQIDDQQLDVEVLNTRGDGDCAFRALAPEEIWREESRVCRTWAADLLKAHLDDPFVVQSLVTEMESRRNSRQLPFVVRDMLELEEDVALDNSAILETYIDSFIAPITNDYLETNPGLEANFLEFPSAELEISAANALAHIMGKRLVIIESNEGFVIYDDADIANIPENFGTEEERQAEVARRSALPILMVAQEAFGEGNLRGEDDGEADAELLQAMQQSLNQHIFRVRIAQPAIAAE